MAIALEPLVELGGEYVYWRVEEAAAEVIENFVEKEAGELVEKEAAELIKDLEQTLDPAASSEFKDNFLRLFNYFIHEGESDGESFLHTIKELYIDGWKGHIPVNEPASFSETLLTVENESENASGSVGLLKQFLVSLGAGAIVNWLDKEETKVKKIIEEKTDGEIKKIDEHINKIGDKLVEKGTKTFDKIVNVGGELNQPKPPPSFFKQVPDKEKHTYFVHSEHDDRFVPYEGMGDFPDTNPELEKILHEKVSRPQPTITTTTHTSTAMKKMIKEHHQHYQHRQHRPQHVSPHLVPKPFKPKKKTFYLDGQKTHLYVMPNYLPQATRAQTAQNMLLPMKKFNQGTLQSASSIGKR
jgi:polyhydroxyalkanoate synthesis regulator phasin